jgi:TetR/AcrR family transcriptional repressor of mexJK operon
MKRAAVTKSRPGWLAPLDDPRDEEILGAAFQVFAEKGFHGATMLDIATRARASKKTVYERFTDKAALFRALIAWGVRQNLPEALPSGDGDPVRSLEHHAVTVLTAMLRPESLALFRIVSAEAVRFPELGKLFDEMVRTSSVAILNTLAERLIKAGAATIRDKAQFGDDFIALVRGDTYFRVLMGALPIPAEADIRKQATHAARTLLAAYARQ